MNEAYLIKNTTRQQREKIVEESLGGSGVGCDDCSAAFYDMYQPYIDGEKEIDEITRGFQRGYISDMERLPREACQYIPQ